MRWLPTVIPLLIAIVALNFALVFAFEAHRVLTSPVLGLDHPAFFATVNGIGRVIGLSAEGLFTTAAFFGGAYLAVSMVFVLHLANRIAALRDARLSHELLDAGLILVVVLTLLAATPAILAGESEPLILGRLPLWLVGLAATLSMVERVPDGAEPIRAGILGRIWARRAARRKKAAISLVKPARRRDGGAVRWDTLREAGGMTVEAIPVATSHGSWFPHRS